MEISNLLTDNQKKIIDRYELINPNVFILLVDKTSDKFSDHIVVPDNQKRKNQTAVATGIILKKNESIQSENECYNFCKVGDRVAFPPGTTISSYIKDEPLIQIIHINNIIMRILNGEETKEPEANQVSSLGRVSPDTKTKGQA